MIWVQRHTGNRRIIAVLVMTVAVLLVVIVPLWLAISTVISNIDVIGGLVRSILSMRIPPPPDWLAGFPLFGSAAANAWAKFTSVGVQQLACSGSRPTQARSTQWFASAAGSLGGMFVQLLLTTAIAAVMYSGGERAAAAVLLFGRATLQ